jgi:hypothetical protein
MIRCAAVLLSSTLLCVSACGTDSGNAKTPPDKAAKAEPAAPSRARPAPKPKPKSEATPTRAGAEGKVINFKFHNLCDKEVEYAITFPGAEPRAEDFQSIDAGITMELTANTSERVRMAAKDGTYGGGAMTDREGGHVWINANCDGMGAADDPAADPTAKKE